MKFVAFTLLNIGITGFALSTGLVPACIALLAPLYRYGQSLVSKNNARREEKVTSPSFKLSVVIPAYNDAPQLCRTLASIKALEGIAPNQIRLIVIADGCTDDTAHIAEANGAHVISNLTNIGKWSSLCLGVKEAMQHTKIDDELFVPDWIGLVDCGVEWPVDFLNRSAPYLRDSENVGFAPSYNHQGSSLLIKLLWRAEACFKRFESTGRGPVSVHGASVFYRSAPLSSAMAALSNQSWLNDDVVIPLMIRSLCPSQRIVYAQHIHITDRSPKSPERAMAQRHRMMRGNLQWIKSLLPAIARRDPLTLLVALRRVARVFWAYWAVFALAGLLVFFFDLKGLIPLVFIGIVTLFSYAKGNFLPLKGGFAAAVLASLLAPVALLSNSGNVQGVQWR